MSVEGIAQERDVAISAQPATLSNDFRSLISSQTRWQNLITIELNLAQIAIEVINSNMSPSVTSAEVVSCWGVSSHSCNADPARTPHLSSTPSRMFPSRIETSQSCEMIAMFESISRRPEFAEVMYITGSVEGLVTSS